MWQVKRSPDEGRPVAALAAASAGVRPVEGPAAGTGMLCGGLHRHVQDVPPGARPVCHQTLRLLQHAGCEAALPWMPVCVCE